MTRYQKIRALRNEGKTMRAIASEFGISGERVRQILSKPDVATKDCIGAGGSADALQEENDCDVLAIVQQFTGRQLPTAVRIAWTLGEITPETVRHVLRRLERQGMIECKQRRPRIIATSLQPGEAAYRHGRMSARYGAAREQVPECFREVEDRWQAGFDLTAAEHGTN